MNTGERLHLLDSARDSTGRSAAAFVIAAGAALIGVIFFIYNRIKDPAFFRKETLTRATPTLVPDE